jgi:prepilin-type N-terminal cleavage/methylation domain-containing protein
MNAMNTPAHSRTRCGFSLIEMLIVVVILSILAAVVIVQLAASAQDAAKNATLRDLATIRRVLDWYRIKHNGDMPIVTEGSATWGGLIGRDYLTTTPQNMWVDSGGERGTGVGRGIILRDAPDSSFHQTYGWVVDMTGGQVWAAGFDGADNPLPR